MRNIRNCNVCVTGGCGFLGSHLVEHLIVDRQCKVMVIDNLVVGRREWLHEEASFEHVDITQSEQRLYNLFREYKTQFVMSYAAYPYIPDSFARPLHVFDVNATGAIKVINAAQEAGCEGILQVSSAEIYGQGSMVLGFDHERRREGEGRIDESGIVVPHSSYGAAKAAIDAMVQVRWKEAKTPCIALRQFNCVGERETHPYVVPEIISQLAKQWRGDSQWAHQVNCDVEDGPLTPNIGVVKLGNNSFRDFLYAGDAVRIAVELLECGEFGQVYNLGSETGINIYNLAKLIGNLMGFADVQVVQDQARVRPWEIWHLQANNTKLYQAINTNGVRPADNFCKLAITPLEEALRKTIDYYNANGRKWVWE